MISRTMIGEIHWQTSSHLTANLSLPIRNCVSELGIIRQRCWSWRSEVGANILSFRTFPLAFGDVDILITAYMGPWAYSTFFFVTILSEFLIVKILSSRLALKIDNPSLNLLLILVHFYLTVYIGYKRASSRHLLLPNYGNKMLDSGKIIKER